MKSESVNIAGYGTVCLLSAAYDKL